METIKCIDCGVERTVKLKLKTTIRCLACQKLHRKLKIKHQTLSEELIDCQNNIYPTNNFQSDIETCTLNQANVTAIKIDIDDSKSKSSIEKVWAIHGDLIDHDFGCDW